MTAGADVMCNDVVRKVEIEDKCVGNGGLNSCDLDQGGNVGGTDNGIVGGDVKDETDESSYVFVSGGIEVNAGGGDVDDSVDRLKEVGFGIEKGGKRVDPLAVETKGVGVDSEVKCVEDDVVIENGSDVNGIGQDVNGHLDKISGEEVDDANEVPSVETKMDDIGSRVSFDTESDSTIYPSDVSVTQSLSAPDVISTTDESFSNTYTVSNTDCEVMVKDGPESTSNVIDKAECQVTVDGPAKPSEDLDRQVTDDGSESFVSPTEEREGQVTVDESGKPSEDLECRVTADGSESSVSAAEEREGQVTVDESGKPSEDLECQVTADGSESVVTPTEELEGQVIVDESSKPSEDLECQVTADGSESSVSQAEEREGQVTFDESCKPSEDLDCQVTADGSKSFVSPTEEQEGQVTLDESGNPSEDLANQVIADGPESFESSIKEREYEVSVDESGNPSEDLASQVTADEPKSFESSIKEQECEMPVDGSDSIGSLVDNQDCSASVESEHSGNHAEEVGGKSEEHQEELAFTSKINVEAEHQSVSVPVPYQSESKKAEGTDIGLSTESEENPDSGLMLSEDTDALANGQAEKFDGILETGETQISGTEADRSVRLMLDAETEKSEEKLAKQMEGSSETLLKVTESVEIETNSEDMKEHVKIEDEIRESQIVVTDSVEDGLNLEDNTTESAGEAEVPLETETNIESIVHVNTASQYEVSNSIDKPQEGFQPDGSSENVETVDPVISECNSSELLLVKHNGSLSTPDELIVVEQKAEIVAHLGTENRAAEDMDCGSGIVNVDASDDDEKETEIKDAPVEDVSHLVAKNRAAEGTDCGTGVENVDVSDDVEKGAEVKDAPHLVTESISTEGMDCGTGVENIDFPDDEEKESEVKDALVGGHSTLSFSDTIVYSGAVIEFGSIGRHGTTHNIQNVDSEDTDGVQSDGIPTSSVEDSVIDAIDVQNEATEVLPYNFLIKIPRFEDENYRDQIRSAQLLVEEKTRLRDAIRAEIHEKRAKLKSHNDAYNAAKTEETAARRLVRLKRQEIDSVQVVINRLKNAMSVEDIDGRILNMEHMIQHETLLLKDEKQFIREIKQLKSLRDQLASNMGSPEEIRQAIDQKDHNEERMKTLRKELDSLKDKASKAEAVVKAVGKTYNEESRRERELQAQFRAADDVRQNAYGHLNSLKKLSYDKNTNFRQFKEDLTAARDFASHGNKDALHRLCANQVETFMEQWNNNDEFRKEYISRCNMNASRRQRASEGGPLVPDDVAPVLPANVNDKADNSHDSIPGDVKPVPVVLPVEEGKTTSSTEKKHPDSNSNNRSIENVPGKKNQTLKTKGAAKPTVLGSDDMAVVAEMAVDNKEEEENTMRKEEIELAKKAEELRKEEIAAKLKEQRRLEEKAKALEALERKKRNAEKAQIRAELRARKEAEQKEKEREKRLRKKEKKKADGGDGSMNGEEAVVSAVVESANEAATVTKDTEPISKEKNKKKAQPPPHFFSKQLKPKAIPPPLVNRNRKRWQQWGKVALAVTGILFLFLLGNTSYFRLKFNGLM